MSIDKEIRRNEPAASALASRSTLVAWKDAHVGRPSVSHHRHGSLPAGFTRDGAHDIRAQQLSCTPRSATGGALFLVARALECQNLCRDARLDLCPQHSHQCDCRFADDFVRVVDLNAERGAPLPQAFKPSAQPQG